MAVDNTALLDRLSKIMGMLGSDHDGERSAAAWQASKLLREAKLTWRDVIGTTTCPMCKPSASFGWRRLAARCLEVGGVTSWERDFLNSLLSKSYPLTPKQAAVLNKIARSLGVPT